MNLGSPISARDGDPSQLSLGTRATLAFDRFWVRRYLPIVTAMLVAIVAGIVIGITMPRGPVDSVDGLILLFGSIVAGFAAGFAFRSQWAALLAPMLTLVTFEIIRRNESGPSVDGIRLDTMFGIIGLVVGRGIFVLVSLFPMAIAAIYGVWAARAVMLGGRATPSTRRWRRWGSRVLLGTATLAVLGLAVLLARPASVPAVTDANGQPIDGSIAEITPIQLGGYEQWIEIRWASPDNPVILYLNGGPGQSDLALSRALLEPLHQDFTVVGWDQRGAGKSYASLDAETLTLESIVNDTIDLTNYLRDRFGQEKIFLLTESWGSVPGILAVQQQPELYYAYLGSGQMVNPQLTDQRIYDDLLAYADANKESGMAAKLRENGPPPYDDIWANAYMVQNYSLIEDDYDPPQAYIDRGEESGVGFWGIMGSEYTLIDKANVIRGLLDMAAVMYPQIQDIDFRTQATVLEVPVYIFDGEHELSGRRALAHEWFAMLDAPIKHMYTFENAGHAAAFEYADELHRILTEEVVPQSTGVQGLN